MADIADILVIFGISGDLAKKMTFQSLYRMERRKEIACSIVGVAINDWSDEDLRKHAKESVEAEVEEEVDKKVLDRLLERLSYVAGDYSKDETYEKVGKAMGDAKNPVFYLEIPPSLFSLVVHNLAKAGLTDDARVVIEKPFGHDLESAKQLNASLHEVLDEEQIMRIDHFLGKEPVMDITYLRFANTVLEPIWNRRYVDSIQITMAETVDVSDRGGFYDPVGTLRDVVQNHLIQVLALAAMEPPSAGPHIDPIRDRKIDLFRSIPDADPSVYVRGQYDGYLDTDGVASDSTTETFVALRLEVDNWRWSGVPFYIRAGKALPVKQTEVRVVFQTPPPLGIGGKIIPDPDEFVLRIEPDAGVQFGILAKKAGEEALDGVHLELLFEQQVGEQPEPYERLLRDALAGDPELFPTQEAIEETWRIVQPLLDEPGDVIPYERGTWGPERASHLLHGHGGWRKPWLPAE